MPTDDTPALARAEAAERALAEIEGLVRGRLREAQEAPAQDRHDPHVRGYIAALTDIIHAIAAILPPDAAGTAGGDYFA